MGKCLSCGEFNPETNDFCAKCGAPLRKDDTKKAEAEFALEEARKEFERDSLASLDRSRITYVCEICGSVNSIDNRACYKCGKPRPRTELVNALRRLRESENIKSSGIPQQAVPPQADPAAAQPQGIPAGYALYRYESNVTAKAPSAAGKGAKTGAAAVQPFIIVPYVNPFQPVYQYQPSDRRVMRYVPGPGENVSLEEVTMRMGAKAVK